MLFVVNELANLAEINQLPGCEDATPDTVEAVLEENAKFCGGVVAPAEPFGRQGAELLARRPGHHLQGLQGSLQAASPKPAGRVCSTRPNSAARACRSWSPRPASRCCNAANLAFALVALLTDGAIEALLTAGTDEQKARYLEPLISGKWTGTMNLTEPQAGSDLAAVRTRAVPQGDGTYKVFGTKIFITYGEHDMAENIIHLVLARTPDAPPGVKGISLFIVPKFMVNADGSLGARNDAHCVSIEHKLGIKASPTAVLQFGDHGGAIGTLVGEENRGLEYMFIMMNAARFGVGMQGIGLAERAYQQAVAFAKDRVQSRDLAGSSRPGRHHQPPGRAPHADVDALADRGGARAGLCRRGISDLAHIIRRSTRKANLAIYEYLVPVIKGWSTEMSRERRARRRAGARRHGLHRGDRRAQHYRDAKILTIYEGTTAIQANDLVGRKTVRDGGAVAKAIIAQVRATEAQLAAQQGADFAAIRAQLAAGSAALEAGGRLRGRQPSRTSRACSPAACST
jgi:alkylation response protein AidB-like acyl-CoA dehydrogenase